MSSLEVGKWDVILLAQSGGGDGGTVSSPRFPLAMGLHDSETRWGIDIFGILQPAWSVL